jgi:hypothetical protein
MATVSLFTLMARSSCVPCRSACGQLVPEVVAEVGAADDLSHSSSAGSSPDSVPAATVGDTDQSVVAPAVPEGRMQLALRDAEGHVGVAVAVEVASSQGTPEVVPTMTSPPSLSSCPVLRPLRRQPRRSAVHDVHCTLVPVSPSAKTFPTTTSTNPSPSKSASPSSALVLLSGVSFGLIAALGAGS